MIRLGRFSGGIWSRSFWMSNAAPSAPSFALGPLPASAFRSRRASRRGRSNFSKSYPVDIASVGKPCSLASAMESEIRSG